MGNHSELNEEIEFLRVQLADTARKHKFNLQHPLVLDVSEQLDVLILKRMSSPIRSMHGS